MCRIALTDLDRHGRDLFVRWAKEAGCTIKVDQLGNIFARREGRDPSKAADHDRQPSRHPADRRQVRRRLRRDGGARGAARAARFGLRHRGADRGRGVDQRGRLPLRAGDGGLGRVRRRLRARLRAGDQGPRRRDLRRGAEEDRLRRAGDGRRPPGRRLLRGAYRAGPDPRAREEDDRRRHRGAGPALVRDQLDRHGEPCRHDADGGPARCAGRRGRADRRMPPHRQPARTAARPSA